MHLAGRVSDRDLHAWYEAADLFVHPTLYEGSSLVTLEAMAHRRAVRRDDRGRAARQGAARRQRLARAAREMPSALAAAISGALGDPMRLPIMGLAGRAIVEREFSWDAAAAATLRLYDELLR